MYIIYKNMHKSNTLKNIQSVTLAGAEGLEPSARGFGDHCSTN